MFLMMNGMPLPDALALSPVRRLAYVVAIGTLKGGRFNWKTRSWEKRE
jgi:hypothetical protein